MKYLLSIVAVLFFVMVSFGQSDKQFAKNHSGIKKVVVTEVLQTTSYTYLHVKLYNDTIWLALPKLDAKVGESYYYQGGNEMRNFKSTQLRRTFESIIFLGGVIKVQDAKKPEGDSKVNVDKSIISIVPMEGAITIAELFENKDNYKGKIVNIKGKVMQFSESIMNRNWIHLQDGTDFDGNFDLIATSQMPVSIGDTVVLQGIVALDKDFGYGYFYKLIMEDCKVIKK